MTTILASMKVESQGWTSELGTFLFMLIFAFVLVYTFRRRNQKTFDDAARMPLDDQNPVDPRSGDSRPGVSSRRRVAPLGAPFGQGAHR